MEDCESLSCKAREKCRNTDSAKKEITWASEWRAMSRNRRAAYVLLIVAAGHWLLSTNTLQTWAFFVGAVVMLFFTDKHPDSALSMLKSAFHWSADWGFLTWPLKAVGVAALPSISFAIVFWAITRAVGLSAANFPAAVALLSVFLGVMLVLALYTGLAYGLSIIQCFKALTRLSDSKVVEAVLCGKRTFETAVVAWLLLNVIASTGHGLAEFSVNRALAVSFVENNLCSSVKPGERAANVADDKVVVMAAAGKKFELRSCQLDGKT